MQLDSSLTQAKNCPQNLAGNAAPAADGVQASANGAGNSEKIPEEKEEASK